MKPLSRRIYAVSALLLAAVLFVAINIAAYTFITTAQIDLTETGQFTLADGTRNIIAKIPEPITLKFYYSKKVAADYAQTSAYAKRVHDLLAEYVALSHGKLILEEVDPEPFTAAEDEATSNGLTGAPTDSGDTVYFGLVGTNRIDGKEVIPYFTPEREAYLDQACAGNEALRRRLAALLQAHESPGPFLAPQAPPTAEATVVLPLEEGPGTVIGRYKLLEKVGEGGFGAVYTDQNPIHETLHISPRLS
jgi:hypothetical protein